MRIKMITKTILPDLPSDVLRLALEDLKKCEDDWWPAMTALVEFLESKGL